MLRRALLMLVLAACSEAHRRDGPRADDGAEAGEARAADIDGGSAVDDAPCSQPVDVRADSPFGPLQVTEVQVWYWGGFTTGTSLVVRGQAGAQAIEIRAQVYTLKYDDDAAPVGEYRSAADAADSSDLSVYASLCDDTWTRCELSTNLRRVQLRVDRHEIPQIVMADSPVRFEGTLRISDPGWSLELPFALRKACGTSVDL